MKILRTQPIKLTHMDFMTWSRQWASKLTNTLVSPTCQIYLNSFFFPGMKYHETYVGFIFLTIPRLGEVEAIAVRKEGVFYSHQKHDCEDHLKGSCPTKGCITLRHRKKCKYFNTETGWSRGETCEFLHKKDIKEKE